MPEFALRTKPNHRLETTFYRPLVRGKNPGAFPKAGPIFQQPFPLPENAKTLAVIAFGAAGKSAKNCTAASKFAGELFQQAIWTATAWSSFLRKGVGGRGFGDQQHPRYSKTCPPELCSPNHKGARKGLNLWYRRDFLVPTPSVCQHLFEPLTE